MTPTYSHEIPIRFLQGMPDSGADLLRIVHKLKVPEFARARAGSEALTDCSPPELNCDAVQIYEDSDGNPVFGLIVEVQKRPAKDKPKTWAGYEVNLARRIDGGTAVLVVCDNERTARWARRVSFRTWTLNFAPIVIGPRDVPLVTSISDDGCALLTLLSAVMNGKDPKDPQVKKTLDVLYDELAELPYEEAVKYGEYALKVLSEGTSLMLEALMKSGTHDYGREIFAKERAEARTDEKIRNFREFLNSTVDARGWALSKEQRQEVNESCDPEMLRRWTNRALRAKSVDEIFE